MTVGRETRSVHGAVAVQMGRWIPRVVTCATKHFKRQKTYVQLFLPFQYTLKTQTQRWKIELYPFLCNKTQGSYKGTVETACKQVCRPLMK